MNDEEYMRYALKLANKAFFEDEVPVGAIIVKDGQIIGEGYNRREKENDISSHAEIEALKNAAKTMGDWHLEGATIYVTLEPCLMCIGAILQAKIARIVFGASDHQAGAIISNYCILNEPSITHRPLVSTGLLEEECKNILKKFFKKKRRNNSDKL